MGPRTLREYSNSLVDIIDQVQWSIDYEIDGHIEVKGNKFIIQFVDSQDALTNEYILDMDELNYIDVDKHIRLLTQQVKEFYKI